MEKQMKSAFASDYMEGAHPLILERLAKSNMEKTPGYGTDIYCKKAKDKIRKACNAPEAEIFFLVGGTQTNATVIDALLKSYQGVVAAATGHISTHEAGAIEFGGHKVLALPHTFGKITADGLRKYIEDFWANGNHEHMVMPGMVYLSQPTEYGTLYSLKELEEIRVICDKFNLPLYLDGARLAYALACPENDATLDQIARLCDVFYIGGTKCGALFGEAVVIPKQNSIPYFFTIMKQHGALLAKGRLLGLQFDTLFTDDLYGRVGKNGIETANELREGLREKGIDFYFETRTNQIFVILTKEDLKKWDEIVEYSFWEAADEDHTIVRLATSWATKTEDVKNFLEKL